MYLFPTETIAAPNARAMTQRRPNSVGQRGIFARGQPMSEQALSRI
jgi:hypothetical protein